MNHFFLAGNNYLRSERFTLFVFLLMALASSIYILTLSWSHTLLDFYPHRQFQTALSIRSMVEGGPWLAYETPLFGEPWSIPFEFPIYQWIVATVVALTDLSIEHASRSVSVFFFYSSLLVVDLILRQWNLSVAHRHCLAILLLTSPLYLFWSRTCMIESIALFLSLAYLYFGSLYLLGSRSISIIFFASTFGVLAAITKITTFFGFSIVLAMLTVYSIDRSMRIVGRGVIFSNWKFLCSIFCFFCLLPLSATYIPGAIF